MLQDNFCSSPWFHIRISPEGNYLPCRWGPKETSSGHNVSNTTLSGYLKSNTMTNNRARMDRIVSPKHWITLDNS